MDHLPRRLLYLLTLWQERPQEADRPAVWRYSLEEARSGERRGFGSPCRTVQYAVDQAGEGDEIRAATGIYTDGNAHPLIGIITQTVYITKTVTVRGGYSADFGAWDPDAYPTTLDAQGAGRVILATGPINLTLEGLRITGGDAAGLYGGPLAYDAGGGGVYANTATTTISRCRIYSNTANESGGLSLWNSVATLSANRICENRSSWHDLCACHCEERAPFASDSLSSARGAISFCAEQLVSLL